MPSKMCSNSFKQGNVNFLSNTLKSSSIKDTTLQNDYDLAATSEMTSPLDFKVILLMKLTFTLDLFIDVS